MECIGWVDAIQMLVSSTTRRLHTGVYPFINGGVSYLLEQGLKTTNWVMMDSAAAVVTLSRIAVASTGAATRSICRFPTPVPDTNGTHEPSTSASMVYLQVVE